MRYRPWILAAGSVLLIVALFYVLKDGSSREEQTEQSEPVLTFYCAMGANEPVRQIIADYEEQTGVKVRVTFDGSKKLFSPILLDQRADLYLAADADYMADAEAAGIAIHETIPIATQRPVIVTAKGNPLGIKTLDDLAKPEVRLFLANPDFAAIGKKTRECLSDSQWKKLWDNKKTACDTVTTVAEYVSVEPTGAGIIWDANVKQYPNLSFIRVPEFEERKSEIMIGVLGKTKHPTEALRFARYLTAEDKGLKVFQDAGYDVVEGDFWEQTPTLVFYAGGLNREAVKDTLAAFRLREGVEIQTLFAGCGSLTGRMDPEGLAERPDIYFACATDYMDRVSELFYEPLDVSGTDMVIGVPHGKKNIAKLEDLAKPGVKVGLCDAKQSALGALSRRLLDKYSIREAVDQNARDYTATAPALITKLSANALDGAIVYRANATIEAERGRIDIVPIEDPDAYARQPIAVGRFSRHRRLSERLVRAILATDSQSRFEALGFDWYGGAAGDE